MAGLDADIWVCGECRSINNLRSRQCYRCRTPRDVAAVDPNQIEGTGHGKLREIALPEFRSTRWAALLASASLIFLAIMQVVSTVADAILFGRVLRDPGQLADPAFYQSVESLVAGTVAIATLGVALLALIAWSFWLSRAVMAMPALGLGYPAANGLMAFVENFLPGLNLFRVPAIVRDVMRRLDPTTVRGEVLIFVAWIGLLGGYLVPRFGTYLGLLGTGTLEEIIQETLLVQAVATALVVVGATFLVALIWWIERRIARRRAAQLAGELPPEASVAGAAAVGDPRLTAQPAPAGLAATDPPGAADSDPPIDEDRIVEPAGTIASRASSATFANRPITAATGAAAISSVPAAPAAQTSLGTDAMAGAPSTDAVADQQPAELTVSAPSAEAPGPTPSGEESAGEAPNGESPSGVSPAPPELPSAEQAPPPARDSAVAVDPPPGTPEPTVEPSPAAADRAAPEPPGDAVTGPQLHLRVESVSSMIATMDGESEPITLDELRVAADALARANGSAVIETVGDSFGALSLAEQAFEVLSDAHVVTTVEE